MKRWLRRIVVSTLLIVISIVAVITLWHQFDEELNPGVVAYLAEADAGTEPGMRAAYYLYGIQASAAEKPEEVGQAVWEQYQHWRAQQDSSSIINVSYDERDAYPEERYLPLPESSEPCGNADAECLVGLIGNQALLESAVAKYAVLAERYQEYMQFDAMNSMQSDFSAPYAKYKYIFQGSKVRKLQLLLALSSNEDSGVTAALMADIAQHRRHMVFAPHLIHKLVHANILRSDLELLAQLYVGGYIPSLPEMPLLSSQEASLRQALLEEFGFQMAAIDAVIDAGADGLDGVFGGADVMARLLPFYFRPNATKNLSYQMMAPIINLSAGSQSEFVSRAQALRLKYDSMMEFLTRPDFYKNITGNVLMLVALPDFTSYYITIYDLNLKLRLLNILARLPRGANVTPAAMAALAMDISNPYYPDKVPEIDEADNQLCYAGPAEYPVENNARCVPLPGV